jgi:hypothetical protein
MQTVRDRDFPVLISELSENEHAPRHLWHRVGISAFDNEHLFGELTVALAGDLPDLIPLIIAPFDNEPQFGAPVVERMAGEFTALLAASTIINAQQFDAIALALIGPILLSAAAFDNAHEFGDPALSVPLQIAAPTAPTSCP